MVQNQLAKGERGDGSLLPRYTRLTKAIKQRDNKILLGERIALIDTGEYWSSFYSAALRGELLVGAKDWKHEMLVERYGESILKVGQDNLEILCNEIFPKIQKRVNEWLTQS